MNAPTRLGDLFLLRSGELLGDHGFVADPGVVERTGGGVTYYRYSHAQHLDEILAADGGLYARLPVVGEELEPELAGGHITEGFLEPLPRWLVRSPYFGDLGLEMLRKVAGELLLRVSLPADFPGLYVTDFAHSLECVHLATRGAPALSLGYDCSNGKEAMLAYLHSYVPVNEYRGGHVAPVFNVVRRGSGIAVPSRYIEVAQTQPLRRRDTAPPALPGAATPR